MLLGGISLDPVLKHHPSVEIDVRALHGHCEREVKIVLGCLVERVNAVSGPLVVGDHLAGDHIRLAGVRLKGVHIILTSLQVILHLRDHLGRSVIHLFFELFGIIRVINKFRGRKQICLDRPYRGKIGISDVILDRNLPFEFRVVKDLPGGSLFSVYDLRIIHDSGHAPHISCRIAAPGLSVDLMLIEDLSDIG